MNDEDLGGVYRVLLCVCCGLACGFGLLVVVFATSPVVVTRGVVTVSGDRE